MTIVGGIRIVDSGREILSAALEGWEGRGFGIPRGIMLVDTSAVYIIHPTLLFLDLDGEHCHCFVEILARTAFEGCSSGWRPGKAAGMAVARGITQRE